MMESPHISQDDIMDVLEMTTKIEKYVNSILNENDKNISMSALISATVNCTLSQCRSLGEIMFYKVFFMELFDESIRRVKLKLSQKPPIS